MLEKHEAQRVENYGALPLLPSPGLCVERKQQKEQAAVAEVMIVVAVHLEKNCHLVPYL